MTGYAETYRRSLERPEEFWAQAAEAIDWERRWDRVLDASRPPFFRWFAGGRLNTCWNAVDRHVAAGGGGRGAPVWGGPVPGHNPPLPAPQPPAANAPPPPGPSRPRLAPGGAGVSR